MIARWHVVVARVVVAGMVAAAAGCGDGGDGIGEDAAAALADRVAEVRATAVADPDAARLHLAALRADVEALREESGLADGDAERILEAAAGLEAVLPGGTTAPPPAPAGAPEADQDLVDSGREQPTGTVPGPAPKGREPDGEKGEKEGKEGDENGEKEKEKEDREDDD